MTPAVISCNAPFSVINAGPALIKQSSCRWSNANTCTSIISNTGTQLQPRGTRYRNLRRNSAKQYEARQAYALLNGETLPELGALETDESTADLKKTLSLTDVVKSSSAVLFVYPKADTSGCTKQACAFNDNRETFSTEGYQIFGISADIPSDQAAWKAAQGYKFTLLSDPSHQALKALGVSDGKEITRSHFLLEKGGKVKDARIGVRSGESLPEALKSLGL